MAPLLLTPSPSDWVLFAQLTYSDRFYAVCFMVLLLKSSSCFILCLLWITLGHDKSIIGQNLCSAPLVSLMFPSLGGCALPCKLQSQLRSS